MKIDENKKKNKFTQRTLEAFVTTLLNLLQEKNFDAITIGELCDRCNYPRSTFYNYFEDIYDLMEYCWEHIGMEMKLNLYKDIPYDERTITLFQRSYEYMDSQRTVIDKILIHNDVDGKMVQLLARFIRKRIYEMIIECPCTENYQVPSEMMVQHYSNTIQLILEWCFLRKEKMELRQAENSLEYLLGILEREVHDK